MGKMLKLAAEQWSFLPILLAWSRDISLSVCREESAVLSWNVGQCSSDSFIPYLSVARERGYQFVVFMCLSFAGWWSGPP